jgi:tetratricopeptide (TPR) repeat protein
MDSLEKTSGANVTRLYMNLGRQLEETLKRLRAEGNDAQAAKVARGFEFFLTRLAGRPASESNFGTLYWVAETFMDLGNSLGADDKRPPAEALNYYQKAAEAYKKLVEACRADAKFVPQPGALTAVQLRLARCLRRLGKCEEAMAVLVETLKDRERLLDAQREAAFTYQAWGEEKPGYFILAVNGGHNVKKPDGSVSHLVWGWGAIARRVQQNTKQDEKLSDVFHEARYNLALCQLGYAESKSGQEKTDQLRKAEGYILAVQIIRPQMGGEKWYGQYDALLKRIQGLLGKKESERGLKAIEQKLATPAKPAPPKK